MKKAALLKKPILYSTKYMSYLAQKSERLKKESRDHYQVFTRCMLCDDDNILMIAFYIRDHLILGAIKPLYQLYIDRTANEFITYDVLNESWRESKIDMLSWPEYYWQQDFYFSKKDKIIISKYLKCDISGGGYKALLRYQYWVREQQLNKKYKKITDRWDLVMNKVPPVPKEWTRWVKKTGNSSHYIFYDYSRKVTEGYCTWCEKTVPIKKPKYNALGTCKCCGNKVQFKSTGKSGYFYTDKESAYLIQRYDSDGFVIRRFSFYMHYKKGAYQNPDCGIKEENRVIFDKNYNGVVYSYEDFRQRGHRWCFRGNTGYSNYSLYYVKHLQVYKRNIPSLAKSVLCKTGLPQMLKEYGSLDVVTYMEAVSAMPYIEKLVKAGLIHLSYEIVFDGKSLEVSSSTGELHKILKINKQELHRLQATEGGVLYLKWLQFENKRKINLPDDIIYYFEENSILPKDLDFISDRMSIVRIVNYLKKQRNPKNYTIKQLLTTWADYLAMAERLKRNTFDEYVYRPKDLLRAHTQAVSDCSIVDIAEKAKELAEVYPHVEDIYHSIQNKYSYADEDYTIVVPQKIDDILQEGMTLRHCGRNAERYLDRIESQDSFVLFLRRTKEVDTPYYTLEVEPSGCIRQTRSFDDEQYDDIKDARDFLAKWQIEIQSRLTSEDYVLAEKSTAQRIESYQELRRTNAKIMNGSLTGYLLADVLEADFMDVPVTELESVG